MYKKMKKHEGIPPLQLFEDNLFDEIQTLDSYLQSKALSIGNDLDSIDTDWNALSSDDQQKIRDNQQERTAERALRTLHQKSQDLIKFHRLNCYLISKTAKKFEKLLKLIPRNSEHNTFPVSFAAKSPI